MGVSFLAKLILSGALKLDEGRINLKNQLDFLLTPALFATQITKYFISQGKEDILYLISWINGYISNYKIKMLFNLDTPEKMYRIGMDFGESMGIGLYKTHDYHPGRYTHFVIRTNPIAELYGKSDRPIDYIIAGGMAGGGCLVHNDICQNVEIRCKSCSSDVCEFLTGTPRELKSRNLWKEVQVRYNLKEILPIQKYLYEEYNPQEEQRILQYVFEELSKLE